MGVPRRGSLRLRQQLWARSLQPTASAFEGEVLAPVIGVPQELDHRLLFFRSEPRPSEGILIGRGYCPRTAAPAPGSPSAIERPTVAPSNEKQGAVKWLPRRPFAGVARAAGLARVGVKRADLRELWRLSGRKLPRESGQSPVDRREARPLPGVWLVKAADCC
jgi:hypothetical protein